MSDRERALRELDRQQRDLNRRLAIRMITWVAILAAITLAVGWARQWW